MLQEFERPLDDSERRLIQMLISRKEAKPLRDTLRWLAIWLCTSAIFLLLFLTLLAAIDADKPWAALLLRIVISPLGLIAALAAGAAYIIVRSHRDRVKLHGQFVAETVPQLEAALASGRVSVRKVTAAGVTTIDNLGEDWENSYLFDVGDGTCLLLRDEVPEDDKAPWPAAEFELVHTAANGHFLGIFNVRGELEPTATVKFNELSESFAFSETPPSQSIMKGTPREVLAQWGYRPGR